MVIKKSCSASVYCFDKLEKSADMKTAFLLSHDLAFGVVRYLLLIFVYLLKSEDWNFFFFQDWNDPWNGIYAGLIGAKVIKFNVTFPALHRFDPIN